MKIKVRSPRFSRQQVEHINGRPNVGQIADGIAERHRFHPGDHTLAVDGRTLQRAEPLMRSVYDGAKVELVLR